MNDTTAFLAVALFVVAFGFGLRSTWRLWRRYQRVKAALIYRERLILVAFVVASVLITVAAGYFGFLTVRRIAGFPPLDWTPVFSTVVAAAVLFIPVFFERVVDRVARDRERTPRV